jgi:DNA-binding response OmpR family regulator
MALPTVLVVDSDVKHVNAVSAELRNHGYLTLEATTFETAKAMWTKERPAALVAGIRLGQFNGLQLLLRARVDRPDVLAIITSDFPDIVLEAETRRFGGAFVVKPVEPHTIVKSIGAVLGVLEEIPLRERRVGERRQNVSAGFHGDRRSGDRRKSRTPAEAHASR